MKSGANKVLIRTIIDYVPRKEVYLSELSKNHLIKLKSVKFDFEDYKVYDKLGCLPYERMLTRCVNNYGPKFMQTNAECRDIANFFQNCVTRNEVFGQMKRMNPEHFAVSEYSRERPHFDEIKI